MVKLGRAAVVALGAAALVFSSPLPAVAKSASGTDSRPVSSRVFASDSPFYQKLPNSTPAATNSAALVSSLKSQAHQYYGTATTPNIAINTERFSTPLYVARNSDPVSDITAWNCQNQAPSILSHLSSQLKGVHIPTDMQPDPSNDGSVAIYNPDSRELVELWRARKNDGKWEACWGGRIAETSKSSGVFSKNFGLSASGIAKWATVIRHDELQRGRIDHVVGLAIPHTKKDSVSWPAVRTDGRVGGTELSIGQMLRLPAGLDIDAMKLSPVAKTIAKAAQEYGVIITDTSGAVSFAAENPIAMAADNYSSIFRARGSWSEMAGDKSKGEVAFPIDKLVVLPLNYRAPTNVGTPPTMPSPAPSASAKPSAPPATSDPLSSTAYAAAVKAAKPLFYWDLSDRGSVAADSSGNGRTATLGGVITSVSGAVKGNAAVTAEGTQASSIASSSASTPPSAFSMQLWFKTTTTSGGKLAGFENTNIGFGSRYDRSLYLTDAGKLVFGTYSNKVSTLTTSETYSDGAWHMVTATQGSDGTKLYVDGVLVAGSSETTAQSGAGYWRLGGGNLKGWPGAPTNSYVRASIDEFAVYSTALSASTIVTQYMAAS